ncbi:glycosyltransferase family 1 protein [Mucilaginibacter sp.]|uniref:glycosyltransferase family 4 protein n=1 Tax=Mucilaginibacter sp. TaxID=1882438 RepID=UPI0026162F7A|nr:glycosyltransferase family 1 protein [Mucilaginibacter sp.]MDB5128621.1 hypothetical protein [Mucilaginibacter sp.]
MSTPKVLVTFDSMKNPNSGYYSFGKGLGDALIDQNKNKFILSYYMFRNTIYFFNNKVKIVFLSRFHRIFFWRYNQYDIVHFTDQTCRLRPWKVKAKRIMTIHDVNNVHLKFKPERKIKALISNLKNKISYCDKVVAISQFVADDIIRLIPEAESKLSVIHNGADKLHVPDNFLPNYVPAGPFVFTIGLLSVQKGFHLIPPLLIGNDYELIIAGIETVHKNVIIEEAEKFGVIDRLKITGPVTDFEKAWYYKNCSAFVFPSIAEGFGLPVIEAMYFGKPVFLSKFTSLPEVGGNVAYYFDNFEVEHMQQVFDHGIKDFKEYNRAEAIINHAGKFSWEKSAEKYLNLYNEVLRD